ncbi:acyltransferase [Lactiplantibacillus garii]|uniref:Acyltransferase n=1 Tax=Lactiplantibacillus garii TaxID=2306423 RepID=A0A426D8C4_9LACO|nr:acyltransferase [Lactiplantibacillus garii]RRK10874.1 acyltransferase [Lactiplantibacillus garii]
MTQNSTTIQSADTGDYLKVAACTAVIMQSVLAVALKQPLPTKFEWLIGLTYNFVKFTAPAFIFGILYTTTRTTFPSTLKAYPAYLQQQWSALFVPTIFWTLVYLLGLPGQQQGRPFNSWLTFGWQAINGNAAPHLWYNTMMLQFILLMPLFWGLARWLKRRPKLVLLILSSLFAAWVIFYDRFVWHGPLQRSWYLLDRVWLSFGLYAGFGTAAAVFPTTYRDLLRRYRWGLLLAWGVAFSWTAIQLFSAGLPVRFSNAPYVQPSMVLYALATIGLISWFAAHQITRHARSLHWIHWLATYAYRAYLGNVCWLQLVWRFSRHWLTAAPIAVTLLSYALTWVLAFAGAVGLHHLKRRLLQSK